MGCGLGFVICGALTASALRLVHSHISHLHGVQQRESHQLLSLSLRQLQPTIRCTGSLRADVDTPRTTHCMPSPPISATVSLTDIRRIVKLSQCSHSRTSPWSRVSVLSAFPWAVHVKSGRVHYVFLLPMGENPKEEGVLSTKVAFPPGDCLVIPGGGGGGYPGLCGVLADPPTHPQDQKSDPQGKNEIF